MASQARTPSDRPTPSPRPTAGAFRPVALPALAAAIKAARGGRPDQPTPRSGR
jgi:hypothetical protein